MAFINKFKQKNTKERPQREIKQENLDRKFSLGKTISYCGAECRVVSTKKERALMIPFGGIEYYYDPVLELHYLDGDGVLRSIELDYDNAISL